MPRKPPEPPVTCRHNGRHQHGTLTMYNADRCRCSECRAASAATKRRNEQARKHGTWYPGMVPAAPVIAHLRMWHDAGMSPDAIAAVSGVHRRIACELIWDHETRPRKWVRRDNAEALLAIHPGDRRIPGNLQIPVHGTRRRVQALARVRWPGYVIAARLGITPQALSWRIGPGKRRITAGSAREITDLYDQLVGGLGPSVRTERVAECRGWAAPWQWDGVDIDDPMATPVDEVDNDDTKQQIQRLLDVLDLEPYATRNRIAARLGVHKDTITTWCRRYERPDIVARLDANGAAAGERPGKRPA